MVTSEEINKKYMDNYGVNIHSLCCIKISSSQDQIINLIANGLEVISCGAMFLCRQRNFFGPIMEDVDNKVA
jgi:hypothetical protein